MICRVSGVLSSKHKFLLASLLTLGPVVWQFVVVVAVYKPNVGRCLYGRRSCSSLACSAYLKSGRAFDAGSLAQSS